MQDGRPPLPFSSCARFPAPADGVAIATRRLEAGQRIEPPDGRGGAPLVLSHTVLEGHRFAAVPLAKGAPLTSWGLAFGTASRAIAPGEYVCNERMLRALAGRSIDFELPAAPNFEDHRERYRLDEGSFRTGRQVEPYAAPGTFRGLRRPGTRGVGTRNFVVVLGTTSAAGPFAQALADRFEGAPARFPGCDGVVAVTHTEGGGSERPRNLDLVLRALAGFLVHPNVGAVLAVDPGGGSYTNDDLRAFAEANDYVLADVPHAFFTPEGGHDQALTRASTIVEGWLPAVAAVARTEEPLSELKLALQCGGSDAFSGVSGNALAGWVAKELIRHGGAANLAETDELIGAEPYVLSNVRDFVTAARFLDKVREFEERAGHHGASAEGNPSGGNNYRGLYNIALKSLGAARKKDPDVRLDGVLDYGQRMPGGGYWFMDSPGNDLESLAGQVASGANLILFITGNGSITNFPFVPTLKFVTTTGRYELLADEMDVNAGRYNDGEPMEDLGRDTFDLALRVASGERSKGELAGHAQVSLWRAWRQADGRGLRAAADRPAPDGRSLRTRACDPAEVELEVFRDGRGTAADRVGLVMPTSLCSGQVARLIAERLNERDARPGGVTRFVALVHTEGCGSVNAEELYLQTLLGHVRHPYTARALLLEHGCEKLHNDAIRGYLASVGASADDLGLASVQLDGGIERVTDKVVAWFDEALGAEAAPPRVRAGGEAVRLGLLAAGPLADGVAEALARLACAVVAAGGTVVVPDSDDGRSGLAASAAFRAALLAEGEAWRPTLAYGEAARSAGLHVMAAPTTDATELVTGLGGTGVEVMLAHVGAGTLTANPLVPLVQASCDPDVAARIGADLDLAADDPDALPAQALALVADVLSGRLRPKLFGRGLVGFQLTRGHLGISL